MLLTVPVKPVQSKHGVAYCTEALRLTACGSTREDARMRLEDMIAAWCRSLEKAGQLREALLRANLHVEGSEAESLRITVVGDGGER